MSDNDNTDDKSKRGDRQEEERRTSAWARSNSSSGEKRSTATARRVTSTQGPEIDAVTEADDDDAGGTGDDQADAQVPMRNIGSDTRTRKKKQKKEKTEREKQITGTIERSNSKRMRNARETEKGGPSDADKRARRATSTSTSTMVTTTMEGTRTAGGVRGDAVVSEREGDQINVRDGERKRSSQTETWFQCMYCDRRFASAQALGGHLNGHRKDKVVNQTRKFLSSHAEFQKVLERSVPEDSVKLLKMLQRQLEDEMKSTRQRSDAGASTSMAMHSPQSPNRTKKQDERDLPKWKDPAAQKSEDLRGRSAAGRADDDQGLEAPTPALGPDGVSPIHVDGVLGTDQRHGAAPEPTAFDGLLGASLPPSTTIKVARDDDVQRQRSSTVSEAPSDPVRAREEGLGGQQVAYTRHMIPMMTAPSAPFRSPFGFSPPPPPQGPIVAPNLNYIIQQSSSSPSVLVSPSPSSPPPPQQQQQHQQPQQTQQIQQRILEAMAMSPARYPQMPLVVNPYTGQMYHMMPPAAAPAAVQPTTMVNVTRLEEENRLLREERHRLLQITPGIDPQQHLSQRSQQQQQEERLSQGQRRFPLEKEESPTDKQTQ